MLKKYKLLDLSRIIVGPYASMVLSDFGVQTTKIQAPGGDPTRQWGPPWSNGTSTYFQSVNRNKKSIALDLTKQKQRNVFYKMAQNCDAILQNFVPGTTDKLGINYQKIKKYNSRVVYCSVSGYGDIGPLKNKPAFDNIIQGQIGFMHLTGSPNTEPFKMGFAVTDVITGLFASNAILAGLLQRESTGKGMHLKTSLYECGMASLVNQGSNYLNGNISPKRMGNHHPNMVPNGPYQAKDAQVVICIGTQKQYKTLLQCLQLQDKTEFNTNSKRVLNRKQFDQYLTSAFQKYQAGSLIQKLLAVNVPCGRINNLEEAFESQITKGLDLVQEKDGIKLVRNPVRYDSQESGFTLSPKLNQHQKQILQQLGYSDKQIDSIFNA